MTNFDHKELDEALKSYFRQVSFYFGLLIPLFGELNFRLRRFEPVRKRITDYEWNSKKQEINKLEESNRQLVSNYVYERSCEYGISTGTRGECKFCSLLNIDLSELRNSLKHSLDHYLKKTLKTNNEYSKIITQLRIEDKLSDQSQ